MNQIIRRLLLCAFVLPTAISQSASSPAIHSPRAWSNLADNNRFARFEHQVDQLRQLLKIPGLSAVIVHDQRVVWARGIGFADLERKIPATPETPFLIASLTKTFAANLLLKLVEEGKLSLDEPVSRYSADFSDDSVRIKHLLSHTSEGTPGSQYRYNGNRFNYLTPVLEKVTGKSFRELLVTTFLDPLEMSRTVPGHDLATTPEEWNDKLGRGRIARYQSVLKELAQPYRLYGEEIVHTPYPYRGIGASAGLISTVMDLVKYESAVDRNRFLKGDTQQLAWTGFMSTAGSPLPHGLGWFVRHYRGQKLIWHYGYWPDSFSAMLLKIPARKLTLVVLANSDALSAPFYRTGGVETSVFACAFLRLFLFEDVVGRSLPDPNVTLNASEYSAELQRLAKQNEGYDYDCEKVSREAAMLWVTAKRVRARTPVKIDPSVYSSMAGRYELDANRSYTVIRDGGRLLIDIPRGSQSELFPESESAFFLKVADVRVGFIRDDQKRATHLEIETGGQRLRASRSN